MEATPPGTPEPPEDPGTVEVETSAGTFEVTAPVAETLTAIDLLRASHDEDGRRASVEFDASPQHHVQVPVATGAGEFEADEGIAPLLVALDRLGILTTNSCQGRLILVDGEAAALRPLWDAGDRQQRFVLLVNILAGAVDAYANRMAYLAFSSPAEARRFTLAVRDATAGSDDPMLASIHDQVAGRTGEERPEDGSRVEERLLAGTFDEVLAYSTAQWDFTPLAGVGDVFDVGFVVRFPAAHVAALTSLLEDRAAR